MIIQYGKYPHDLRNYTITNRITHSIGGMIVTDDHDYDVEARDLETATHRSIDLVLREFRGVKMIRTKEVWVSEDGSGYYLDAYSL